MRELRRPLDVRFVDHDGDLNLRRGDQLNIDPAAAEAFEKLRCDTGMRAHSDPNDAQLGDLADRSQTGRADLAHDRREQLFRLLQLGFVDGERKVGRAAVGYVLHDHVDNHVAGGDGGKNAATDPGFVRHS